MLHLPIIQEVVRLVVVDAGAVVIERLLGPVHQGAVVVVILTGQFPPDAAGVRDPPRPQVWTHWHGVKGGVLTRTYTDRQDETLTLHPTPSSGLDSLTWRQGRRSHPAPTHTQTDRRDETLTLHPTPSWGLDSLTWRQGRCSHPHLQTHTDRQDETLTLHPTPHAWGMVPLTCDLRIIIWDHSIDLLNLTDLNIAIGWYYHAISWPLRGWGGAIASFNQMR